MLSCLSESSSSMLQKAAHLWSDLHISEWALHQQPNHLKLPADWLLRLSWINPLNPLQKYHLKNVLQHPSSYINFITKNLYFHIFHSSCHLSLTPTLSFPPPPPPALSFTNIHIQTQHTHISSYSLGKNTNFPQASSKVISFVLLSSMPFCQFSMHGSVVKGSLQNVTQQIRGPNSSYGTKQPGPVLAPPVRFWADYRSFSE